MVWFCYCTLRNQYLIANRTTHLWTMRNLAIGSGKLSFSMSPLSWKKTFPVLLEIKLPSLWVLLKIVQCEPPFPLEMYGSNAPSLREFSVIFQWGNGYFLEPHKLCTCIFMQLISLCVCTTKKTVFQTGN